MSFDERGDHIFMKEEINEDGDAVTDSARPSCTNFYDKMSSPLEFRYFCNICKNYFSRKDALTRHMKSVHRATDIEYSYKFGAEPFSIKRMIMHYDMKYEKFRIESFKKWPLPYINVRELARNGLFYIGVDDIVECTFCQIRICNWESDDDVAKEHKKWAPYCPLIRGLETDNIKLQSKYQ